MSYGIRNLVFEGGGMKGIAYIGALQGLEERGILERVERVGGASVGALNALLVGLGYTAEQMRIILWSFDFKRLFDDSWGIIPDIQRLLREYGWYKGQYFLNWVSDFLWEKCGSKELTFEEFEGIKSSVEGSGMKSLYFMGTNIATGRSEIFSAEATPYMRIADAVRISISIPFFFAAVRRGEGDLYVDGGLIENYPVKMFDRRRYIPEGVVPERKEYYDRVNRALFIESGEAGFPVEQEYVFNGETLGFRLDAREEISLFRDQEEPPRIQIDNFFDYSRALIRTVIDVQQNYHLHSDDWQRTVYIDTLGVSTTEWHLAETRKNELIESGGACTEDYFRWLDTVR